MTALHLILSFLAASAEEQIAALPHLPADPGDRNFYIEYSFNSLVFLHRGFQEEAGFNDLETAEEFVQRTGLSLPFDFEAGAYGELSCLMWLVPAALAENTFWTKRGLQRKTEWRLIRRLALFT